MSLLAYLDVVACIVIAISVVERARIMNINGNLVERVALSVIGAAALGCAGEIALENYSPLLFGSLFRIGVAAYCVAQLTHLRTQCLDN